MLCLSALLAACGQFSAAPVALPGNAGASAPAGGGNGSDGTVTPGPSASSDGNIVTATPGDGSTAGTAATAGTAPTTNAVAGKASAFSFGAIIDYDGLGPHGKQSVAGFVAATQVVPHVVDSYVRLKSDGTFEADTAKTLMGQAVAAKVPTVCLSVTSEVQGNLSAAQLASLAGVVSYGKSVGLTIEVRFGYEMNGYWSPSNTTNGVAYAPANFLQQWAQVAPAVHAAGGKMLWSPNIPFNEGSALARWLPTDTSSIDIVGLDYYPKANPLTADSVRTAINTIYPIAQKLNKPMVFGETAWPQSGGSIQENAAEAQSKITWFNALTDPALRKDFPLYVGLRWFDYQKYEDNVQNNWSISADPYAATAFSSWYKTSVFNGK